MTSSLFFPYSWHTDDNEEEITSIRIYGLSETNKNICVRIDNFTPYVYIELPTNINWNSAKAQLVGNKIDELTGNNKPLSKVFLMKKRLYRAYFDENGNRKKFPYLFVSFSHKNDIKILGYRLRKSLHVVGLGAIQLKIHESDADPILQLVCCRNIPTAGWVKFSGNIVPEEEKLTLCDEEYTVKWKTLAPVDRNDVPRPKVMGFDIEVNSTNPSAMPKAEKPGDKVFQISCIIARTGDTPDKYDKYLLTLGQPEQEIVGEDVLIYMYDTEAALLEGFTELIREENPNLITGYNILGFDIPYMIARAKLHMCIFNFDRQGFHKTAHAREKIIKWSSSAYKNQEFEFLDAEGRVFVDLLPLVRRDFKFNSYSLKTVSEYFIGETKDPLGPKGIFKCYRVGIQTSPEGEYLKRARKAMGIVGRYCTQDSVLVVLLMEKLKTWVGLTEMAKTCRVSMFALYTQGQQIKVYSQLYDYCMKNDIVVEKDAYQVQENERYQGAKVFPPIPGRYKMVVPFDFCFTGDTLVTMANGCSKRIDTLISDETIIGYMNGGLQNFQTTGGLQVKGQKETIKLYLENGKVITCTPDHKFMLSNGEWEKACNLKDSQVMCGIDYPEDSICELEETWSLLSGLSFRENRENILAKARISGYNYNSIEMYFPQETNIDYQNFQRDLKLSRNIETLPLLDEKCPKSVIREFLGGMYGRLGIFNGFDPVILPYSSEYIIFLHKNLDIIYEIRENSIVIQPEHFSKIIGFRYCINKSCKLSIVPLVSGKTIKNIRELGLENWFLRNAVKTNDTHIPCYRQKVVDIMGNGLQDVYDIEVDKAHNFIANGVIVHNCSLYPTTIIAYNIDYHTWVPDDSNIPDSMCHVMDFWDHVGCIVKGTKITVGEYSIPIEDIANNIKVLAYDFDKQGLDYSSPRKCYNR